MPQVTVRYDARHVRANHLLVKPITKIVADALSCTDNGGSLMPRDIEVEFRPFGDIDENNGYTITVQIDANEYPSRQANLQERNKTIAMALQDLFKKAHVILTPDVSNRKAFVWTRLMPAGFAEFNL